MSTENKDLVLTDANQPKLTGRMYKVENPDEGADISHEKYMFGKPFNLKRGTSKEMDETIAKSAKYNWGFLKISEVAGQPKKEKEEDVTGKVHGIELVDDTYEYPELGEGMTIDPDKYTWAIQKKIAGAIKLTGNNLMKADTLRKALMAFDQNVIMAALKTLKIPAYLI